MTIIARGAAAFLAGAVFVGGLGGLVPSAEAQSVRANCDRVAR